MTTISRAELGARIMKLPSGQRELAVRLMRRLAELGDAAARKGARSHATRDVIERRRYAESRDPWAYARDVFGYNLTPQQDEVLEALLTESRLLVPSANNMGKTFILALWGLFRFDAMGAMENPDSGDREQGARILLPGPDHDTVFETLYSEMLVHAARAEMRGHLMPGTRSELSVNWRVRPMWNVEVFSPPARVARNVTHTASGRHHRNQCALVEEGQGVAEPLWRATEGMCSSAGNQIVSSFNPTEPVGAAYNRATNGTYRVIHLDAFDHPNVRERRLVIPDAVDFRVVDGRVRDDCRDRGPFPATPLEAEYGDFVYGLPRLGTPERGPREDGEPGHPDAPLRVYRPGGAFQAQVRGEWPSMSGTGLFDPAALERSMARWREQNDPDTIPDRVGADPAREGRDDATAVPSWGETAEQLLRAYALAEQSGEAAINTLLNRRTRVGEIVVFPKSDGVTLARSMHYRFPDCPFSIDDGSVGTSPIDHLARVLGRDVVAVSFSAAPHPPVNKSEPWSENLRTQLYLRAALATNRDLIDWPDDPLLKQELLAHSLEYGARVVEQFDSRKGRKEKIRVTSVALIDKDTVKKAIGRSPDRSDGSVLSLYTEAIVPKAAPIQPTVSRRTLR